ncbi:MAG TPA: T9SS type A sorting domain-containing protein [Chryseosolibacter sp.]
MRYLLSIVLVLGFLVTQAQNYRTRANGNWSSASTWQVENAPGVWVNAVAAPDLNANTIIVRHNLNVTENVTIDQTSIRSGSTIQVFDGVTLTVNNGAGTDLLLNMQTNLHLLGEGHLAGNGYVVFGGSVYLYSTNATGAITAGTGATGNIRVLSRNFTASCTLHYANNQTQYVGSGHPATVGLTTVINNPANVILNNTASANVTFGGTVNILAGELVAENDNITASGTVVINGGGLRLGEDGSAKTHVINNVTYTSGTFVITNAGSAATLSARFNGVVDLAGGNANVSSGTGNLYLLLYGDVSGAGYFAASGANNHIRFFGNGNFTKGFPLASGAVIKVLTIDRPGLNVTLPHSLNISSLTMPNGTLVLGADMIVASTLNIGAGGVLNFSGQTLELRNSYNASLSGGLLVGSQTSTLILSNAGSVGALNFAGGTTLGTFTLDRSGSVSFQNAITIRNTLNLLKGTLNNSAGLSLGSGAVVNRHSNNSVTGTAFAGGPYSVIYTGTSLTAGPDIAGPVSDITSNVSGTVTLGSPISASGTLSINSGTWSAGANSITIGSIVNNGVFNAPSSTLSLSGNITNTNLFAAGSGTVVLNGSSIQNIDGGSPIQFNNLTLANNASASIETVHSMRGILTLGTNTSFDADGAGNSGRFTLMSYGEASGSDAMIAQVPASATITGEFTVQRFVSGIDDTHRFISSPVTNASVAQLQDDVLVTGEFEGTDYPCEPCSQEYNGASLRWFNQEAGGLFEDRWAPTPVTQGTNDELLVPGRGYDLYMWDGADPVVLDFTGPVNYGNFDFGSLAYTPSTPADQYTDGWHLLGNPYPAPIIWNTNPGWSRTNIEAVVWVWDEAGQVWRTANFNSPGAGNLPNGRIASGQGFWVRVLSGGGQLSITEAVKSTSSNGTYYREKELQNEPAIVFTLRSNGVEDNAYLLFSHIESDGIEKLITGRERMTVGMEKEGKILQYQTITTDDAALIPLTIIAREKGEMELLFDDIAGGLSTEYMLIDRMSDDEVQKGVPIKIQVSQPNTKISGRFFLAKRGMKRELASESLVSYFPNPVTDLLTVSVASESVKSINLTNQVGQVIKPVALIESNGTVRAEISLRDMTAGLYFLNVTFEDELRKVYKIIKR